MWVFIDAVLKNEDISSIIAGIAAAASVKSVSFSLSTISSILPIIGFWFLFEVKNEDGWKAIIPIYRDYIAYKLFFKVEKFWVFVIAAAIIALSAMALAFGIGLNNIPIILVSMIVLFASMIVMLVVSIQFDISICKKYGQGVLFTIMMIFFSPLFICILAYLVKTGKAHEIQ